MSATPIPRTLHIALAGIRDISVIDTAPNARLPIRTFVTKTGNSLIRDVILREIERGGQVFFVHNRVHSIAKVVKHLHEVVPEARIGVGMGDPTGANVTVEATNGVRLRQGTTDMIVLDPAGGTVASDDDSGDGGSGGSSNGVYFENWPEYIDTAEDGSVDGPGTTLANFTEQTGIKIKYTGTFNDNNEYFAKIQPLLSKGRSIDPDMLAPTFWMAGRLISLAHADGMPLAPRWLTAAILEQEQ